MERTPHISRGETLTRSHEEAIEQAIVDGHAEVERRLGCKLSEATALDRVSVTAELLNEIEERNDNRDRFVAEVYAGMRKLAELELDFQMAKQKLNALYQ